MNKGILYGTSAYILWGILPIYWKLLHNVPALQLIGHRIVWSLVLLVVVLLVNGQWQDFRVTAINHRILGIYMVAAVLLSVNWLVYVWGVNAGFIVETSLGYFINPLLSVLLGVILLRERLRPAQWVPIGLAAAGVLYLTAAYGSLPWIALSLAFSFGFYGLVKKVAPLSALYGLTVETGMLLLPAIAFLVFSEVRGSGAFLHAGFGLDLLMVGAGLVTTVPLLMFASAARRIPLSFIGVLQYIAPTMQFLIGVFIYKEPFDKSRLVGFSLVWIALVIFWVENLLHHRMPVEPLAELGEG